MEAAIRPGLEGRVEKRVEARHLADTLGNKGARVLATPVLIGLLEDAASQALLGLLPPGTFTVGTLVQVRHLKATPPGLRVVARGRLREVDGRRLVFDVEAYDEVEKIAEGVHERFIVDAERFLAKVKAKKRERDAVSGAGSP